VIFELRQYTLKPGARDTLVEMFDREFTDSQEALGSYVVGQFRDLDRPDYFVWMRSFTDMSTRLRALTNFYGGPVWQAHREAANATMVDTDDVYLLRGDEIAVPRIEVEPARSTVIALIAAMDSEIGDDMFEKLMTALEPVAATTGMRHFGTLRTDRTPNDYPRLSVRTDEDVVVSLLAYDGSSPPDGFDRAIADAESVIGTRLRQLRLEPTRRSRVR
jgi:NIPSNAP protein